MGLNNYNEDSIKTLGPREAVRENYAMYIGDNTSRGFHHLFTEIVANAMDEFAAGFGNIITVDVDSNKNKITITDRGRGIPFRKNKEGKYAIIEMCTSLHSGGKFANEKNYKSSLGLHGLGATVTNALSSYFEIRVKREDGNCVLIFENGKQTQFEIKDCTNDATGSIVSFIPDKEIFGNERWNIDTIKNELQLHALLNNNLTFIFNYDGEQLAKFCYSNGIKDMLSIKFGDEKPLTNPIYSSTVINEGKDNECLVEIGLRYNNSGSEKIYAFTNGGYNPDFGTHVTGFKSAWTTYVNNKGRELGLIGQEEENLDGGLIRKGLCLILSIKMNERPMFAEQTKLKLTSPSARSFVSQAVGKMVISKVDIEAIVNKALIEKSAEDAAQRKREAEKRIASGGKKVRFTDFSDKFADRINKTGGELFLVEGNSAGGSAKTARNVYTQAIYPMRGKPKNTYGKELADIITNKEIQDILSILGCGIGDNFNIKNLRYDKIIFMADADTDGGHINCLLTTLFLFHVPQLIEAGVVYCAVPPLYKVTKGKESHYLYSPDELNKFKGYEVTRYKGLDRQVRNLLFV